VDFFVELDLDGDLATGLHDGYREIT
jgi:hypothetical protein